MDAAFAADRVDHARKLGQQAIAGILHSPAAVLFDFWLK